MALLCCLLTNVLSAQTIFTNASGDQSWLNPANWDNGLPADGNDPTIPLGFTANLVAVSDYIFDFNVTNNGILEINLGDFNVNNGGFPTRTLTNTGTITVNGGGIGLFTNLNNIINTVTGRIAFKSLFVNNNSGVIDNEGLITNMNYTSHSGTINNINNGIITNNECATFRGENGSIGPIANTFTNNGITYILGTATMVVTTNNGVILTNPGDTASPTANCIAAPLVIDLDTDGLATITENDINDGSEAIYCVLANITLSQTDFNCAFIGNNTVTLTVFDGNGVSSTCTATVTVNDPILPTITCPIDLVFNLAPGACDMAVNFNPPTVDDNCPGFTVAQTDATGLSTGSIFEPGVTTLSYEITDSANNTADCSFTVTVNEYDPGTSALICDQSVDISLDANCEAIITPAAALEGNYGCYDDFTVDVNSTGTALVNMANLGQTVSITVTHNISGNSCWGFGLVEEKLPPQIIVDCQDTIVNCLQDVRPISEGGEILEPTFNDCSPFNVSYYDTEVAGGCNDPYMRQITRTFTAVDAFGESHSCSQIITVESISIITNPPTCPGDYELECVVGGTPDFSPEITGYPMVNINGIDFELNSNAINIGTCSMGASYSDAAPLDKCGAGFLVIRTWSIFDWCTPLGVDNPVHCFQQLRYVDHTAPVIAQPADITLSTNQTTCFSTDNIPGITADDCSDFDVVISTPIGAISANGGAIPFPGLAPGTYTITYIATDDCSNSSQATAQLTIIDDINPQMICDTYTTVSLDNTGTVTASASVFDDGSSDNCCIMSMTARRLNNNCNIPSQLNFGSEVTFCCADVGVDQLVEFRIDDCNGNWNSCMVVVTVQDINLPTITCPDDITIECEEDYNDFSVVGQVVTDAANQTAIDGLSDDACEMTTVTHSDTGTLSCGTGTIVRVWVATDIDGNSIDCFHVITVEDNNPFDETNIDWPDDDTFPSCDVVPSPTITGEPDVTIPNGCAEIVISFSDQISTPLSGNLCKKISRTWTVTNMCQFVPNSGSTAGQFTYEQTIILEDFEGPVLSGCIDVEVCNFKPDCSDVGVVLAISATDNCTDNIDLDFSWEVDIFNDGIADTGINTSGIGQNLNHEYPNGEHSITYEVVDHCGNTSTCTFLFTIEDCKKPTPFCDGTNTTIMQGGSIAIPINQFIHPSSNDNCTAFNDLEFSFSANINDDLLNFDCDDLGENIVEIWVTDEANNQDFCTIIIDLQDNTGSCVTPLFASLGGQVTIEESVGVEEVMVEVQGPNYFMNYTNNDGDYMFNNLPGGSAYMVTPQLDEDPLNGVSTLDLVILKKHILNTQVITSPYKLIAADANNSGSISTLDLLTLRKLILQITPNFPNNTSWRFVDAAYEFPNPQDPFTPAFPESYTNSNLDDNDMQGNFIAVKIGDLNESATVNNLQAADDRTEGIMTLTAENLEFKTGELVSLVFASQTLEPVQGYQFTMNFDVNALEFVNLNPGTIGSSNNFGLSLLEEGAITTSWDYLTAGQSIDALMQPNTMLFRLVFRAKTDGKASELIHLNSRFTKAESYSNKGITQDVELIFTEPNGSLVSSESFELYQNLPNPFRGVTTIGFHFPEATVATLTITDITGKILKTIKNDYPKGYHQIDISKNELNEFGVLYYRLETPKQTATKKMLLLR